MAKLEGVKTLDMVGGEITKVEYDGEVYEKVEGEAREGDVVQVIVDGWGSIEEGAFYIAKNTTSGATGRRYTSIEFRVPASGYSSDFAVFRKVSESSTPTIEQVGAKVDALAERVTKLEGEKKDESTPKTVKRKARVGERILITEAAIGEPYNTGDVFTVSEIDVIAAGDVHVKETSKWIDYREYEVIIEEESKPAPTFSEGDRVKAIANGEDGDITAGEIGIVDDIYISETDPYTIGVETDDDYDYFRPQDLELVEDEPYLPYKPSEGDIVVITGNTNHSRNAVGDIGKVGRVREVGAIVNVPGKTKGNGNFTLNVEMRPATDGEKAEYERAAKFAKLGRKPGEFKKGDIVRGHRYEDDSRKFIGEVEDVVSDMIGVREYDHKYHAANKADCELIAPVESRVDLDD